MNLKVRARYLNPYILMDVLFGRASLRNALRKRRISTAAEIGVQSGINAATILRRARPARMVLADPYEGYSPELGMSYIAIERLAHRRLRRHRKKCEWVRSGNRDLIARMIGQATIDYLYIDAAHDYVSVMQDMQAYWPCVATGGMMAGHDIIWPSVFRAVADFAATHDLDVQCSGTDWWVVRRPNAPADLPATAGKVRRDVGSPTQVSLPHGGTAYEFDEDSGPPPEDWICPTCKANAGDWSRPIDQENIEVNHCDPELAGLWECGHCGNTEWVPPPNAQNQALTREQ